MIPLIIIPARGGSKGVQKKNIKLLGGKPLIQYTLEAAASFFPKEVICVSTDDVEIKNVTEKAGYKVPFLRPAELASDTANTYDVLLHAVKHYEDNGYSPDTIILLQPTSPFRTTAHIKEALELYLQEKEIEMLVSVKEAKSNPYFTLFEEDSNGHLKKSKNGNFIRRQDCPKVWEYNGAIYIINISALKQKTLSQFTCIKKYVMNGYSSIDIDTELDWQIAEFLVKKDDIFFASL